VKDKLVNLTARYDMQIFNLRSNTESWPASSA